MLTYLRELGAMPTDLLLAFTGFAFATSVTPGPNNMMLLASGVNFGFRRAIPHMLGVTLGFVFLVIVVGLGLGGLLTAVPALYAALKVASVLYMLWLAWKIATSGPIAIDGDNPAARPMTFLEAALFQWVNPKGWAMALTATATYTVAGNYLPSLIMMAVTFGIINVPSAAAWVGFGTGLRKLLQDPVKVRIFNVTMAVLLIASLYPILVEWAPVHR